MSEQTTQASEPHPMALEIGRLVSVNVLFRADPSSPWLSAAEHTDYRPWVGQIAGMTPTKAINGFVNVLPLYPVTVDGFLQSHPSMCDLSPRTEELPNGHSVEIRHVLAFLDTIDGNPDITPDTE
jgi:hypothetical protein